MNDQLELELKSRWGIDKPMELLGWALKEAIESKDLYEGVDKINEKATQEEKNALLLMGLAALYRDYLATHNKILLAKVGEYTQEPRPRGVGQ